MNRALLVLAILAIGGVAPARAWCEATCLAPTAGTASHCPERDQPADGTTSMSAAAADECPVLESARPAAPGRLDASASLNEQYVPTDGARSYSARSSARPRHVTTVFERSTPLRI